MTDPSADPLFEPIARAPLRYQVEVAPLQRLMVRVAPSGDLFIRGQRSEIEALLDALRQRGVELTVDYISFCG